MDDARKLWDDVRTKAATVRAGAAPVEDLLAAIDAADPVLDRLRPDRAEMHGVAYDHGRACVEVAGWRATGECGATLNALADAFQPRRRDMAVHDAAHAVVTEALRRCAALRPFDPASPRRTVNTSDMVDGQPED